jgi:membrane-associated phospholipid phosphatase
MASRGVVLRPPLERTSSASFDPFHSFNVLMLSLLLAVSALEILLAHRVHLVGIGKVFAEWKPAGIVAVALVYVRWRPLPRLSAACELCLWEALFSPVLKGLIEVAARSPYPLVDNQLSAIDRRMHLNTWSIVHAASRWPLVSIAFSLIYATLPLMLFAATILPAAFGRVTASRRFVLGIALALLLTASLFAVGPAAGPWTVEKLQPTLDQQHVGQYLQLLKAKGPATFDLDNAALVSFPSFHVVLAILSAVAIGSLRRLRGFAFVLAALICISTLTTGWHYIADVLGGLAVSFITVGATRRLVPQTSSEEGLRTSLAWEQGSSPDTDGAAA